VLVLSHPLGELGRPYEPVVVEVAALGLESSYLAAGAERPGVQLLVAFSEEPPAPRQGSRSGTWFGRPLPSCTSYDSLSSYRTL
jgi:hypothetical protein